MHSFQIIGGDLIEIHILEAGVIAIVESQNLFIVYRGKSFVASANLRSGKSLLDGVDASARLRQKLLRR